MVLLGERVYGTLFTLVIICTHSYEVVGDADGRQRVNAPQLLVNFVPDDTVVMVNLHNCTTVTTWNGPKWT